MSCAVIGDSIAVGVASTMPECEQYPQIGLSAAAYVQRMSCHRADLAVISLGSNPGASDETYLRIVRRCQTGRVVWLLPPARDRELVRAIAAEYGDAVIDVREGGATADRIHPSGAGYSLLAQIVRSKLNG